MSKIRSVFTDAKMARRLAVHVWRHFQEDRCFQEAASLSYTSLLSLVPLLAVVFGIASAFPVFRTWSESLQDLVFANMVPASGEQVQQYLQTFIQSVNKLTLTGFIVLILTALLLMMRIESSFNLIWRVPVPRSLVNKVIMYWAVLTLGPLALGGATALSAQQFFDLVHVGGGSGEGLRTAGTFVLTWVAFGLMFILVPNCRVPVSYAAVGALLSTVLFSAAKAGFVIYIGKASYNVIYGALATIPIFLFWLYLVWVVILLGVSLSASLNTFSDRRSDWRWPLAWELLLVVRLLGHLYQAQTEGRSVSTEELQDAEPGVVSSRLQHMLVNLMEQHLITQDNEGWVLKRDLGRYTLLELYQSGDYHLPIGKKIPIPSHSKVDPVFMEVLADPSLNLDQPLKALYERAWADT